MESRQYTEDIDLKKYWLILRRRWLPSGLVFVLVVTLATAAALIKKPNYEAAGRLLFKKKNTTSSLVTEAGEKIGQLDTLNMMNTPVDTEAQVLLSMPIIQKTIESLNLKDAQGKFIPPAAFLVGVGVKPIKGTDVLQVTYKSRDPKQAADAVNQLMNAYVEMNILTNRAEAAAAREFIAKELPKVLATVRQAEAALRKYREQNNIVALQQEAIMAVDAITGIDRQLTTAQAQLADATARASEIQKKINLTSQQAVNLSSASQSTGVQQTLEELQKVEAQLTLERTRFQETHPLIIDLVDKRNSLKALLQQRVGETLGKDVPVSNGNLQLGDVKQKLTEDLVTTEAERLGLLNQVTSLSRARTAYQQRASVIPKLQQGEKDLERQVEAAQASYQILLKNYQEVQIAENQNVGNARVIEYASIPGMPADDKRKLIIAAGIVAGAMLYVVTAFLFDLADPSLKTAKEVREIFKYTVLGMIPSFKKKMRFRFGKHDPIVPPLPVQDSPHSIISETYRMLQANLKFLSPDRPLKVIVVTSSVSKEGKSTVSANLATAMAQLGRRVLLIDGDLHHPIQHHIWDLTNVAGLSDVIVGQADVKMAVKSVMDNLDVLPSGVIPPNPLALLDSQRMTSLIADFSTDYNFVIIDTPPLVLVPDALSLGKLSDGVLVVVRPGVLDAVSAAAAKSFLVQSGQNILGLVVNGVIIENEPDSYFHHARAYYQESTTSKVPASRSENVSSRS
ncbi:polysaccharide biosynthesis tyrosine autokinase [Planktothrix sp. FACHB-1355]|uniref:non-specific protein-tyrosine kinase n=1 Tax=Aerosakkonema funiforme FACHB-1375 TaxID=2949571 RepID=A0A926VI49_9CYAN|nr:MULTISPECIES: polysaccharide biosynthesis tyrosine autokinase [Oscillatoriales]MBD2183573.1 polysaccharide biosynthesis tyrosine autokinase [Aerosakkonema funiforme FACHB-1375]MBD3559630.1 polysaccharide biosynthesis tyrosine autokinase [Planktothrix sp. FACHB-1355]